MSWKIKLIELRDTSDEESEIYAKKQLDAIIDIFCISDSNGGNIWRMDTQLFETREEARQEIINTLMNVVYDDKSELKK